MFLSYSVDLLLPVYRIYTHFNSHVCCALHTKFVLQKTDNHTCSHIEQHYTVFWGFIFYFFFVFCCCFVFIIIIICVWFVFWSMHFVSVANNKCIEKSANERKENSKKNRKKKKRYIRIKNATQWDSLYHYVTMLLSLSLCISNYMLHTFYIAKSTIEQFKHLFLFPILYLSILLFHWICFAIWHSTRCMLIV